MEVEISKASGVETPASQMSEYVVEHATALMSIGGIESISSVKYSCGFGSRLHVSITPFDEAPEEIKLQGIVMKDAIGQIISVANITRIVIKPSGEDLRSMKKSWEDSMKASKDANGGSGQDFSVKHEKAGAPE